LLPQDVTHSADVPGDNGQCNITFKTIDAMVWAFV